MKKLKVFSISAILLAICCCLMFPVSASAASKIRSKFDHKPSGNIYYYDKDGHTVKGLVTIKGKNITLMKRESSRMAGRRSKETIISSRSVMVPTLIW